MTKTSAGSRSEIALAERQLRAVEAFNRARRAAEIAAAAVAGSREMRLDASRRLSALRREHEALIERAHAQMVASGQLLRRTAPRRAVIAHRQEWFVSKARASLAAFGVEVVAATDNGADAIGISVAEQPDLVIVEDALLMVSGPDVVREVRTYVPPAVIGGQVSSGDRIAALLDAGASAAFTRQVSPDLMVEELFALLPA